MMNYNFLFFCLISSSLLFGSELVVRAEVDRFDQPPAQAFFRSSPEPQWHISIDRTRAKSSHEYDVIVVGSGIGGLMAAALMSCKNYHVLVLEQDTQVGGYCVSYERKGFTFTAGVEDISGIWPETILRKKLEQLLVFAGIRFDDLFERNRRLLLIDSKKIDLSDPAIKIEDIIIGNWNMSADKANDVRKFFKDARTAYEKFQLHDIRDSYWFGQRTYQDVLDEKFPDSDPSNRPIRRVLTELVGYVGSSPRELSAAIGLNACMGFFLNDGYYVKGHYNNKCGAGALAEVLAAVVRKNGGAIKTHARVTHIARDVTGETDNWLVHVKNYLYEAPVVVLNANPYTGFKLFAHLEQLTKEIAQLARSRSGTLIHFGINRDIVTGYPNLFDITLQLLEPNKTSITVLTKTPNDLPTRIMPGSKHVNDAYKNHKHQLMLTWREKIPQILEENIGIHVEPTELIFGDIATKYTFERYTSMPNGAWYGIRGDQKKLHFKTPLRGVYLASASAIGFGGIETVMKSGIKCANDIVR